MSTPAENRLQRVLGQLAAVPTAAAAAACPRAAAKAKPLNVVVTGAAGNIAYAIVFMIGQGAMLGREQRINLRLLDIPAMVKKMEGLKMELLDCAFPLLASVTTTADYETAFRDADVALLIGALPRSKGMQRADLLKANAAIFEGQGKALNKFASRDVKVCVVGNPANTNALIAMANAPDLPRRNFSALTRLDQNRAVSQIAERVGGGLRVEQVRNVIIWGNHSATQYPDVSHAVVLNHPHGSAAASPVRAVVNDDAWLRGAFVTTVQERGAAIIEARGLSSAASAANAVVDHMRAWLLGTAPGEFVSMAVVSDGNKYGVPDNLIYSFPVSCTNGQWHIVDGLAVDAFSADKLEKTTAELLGERKTALGV